MFCNTFRPKHQEGIFYSSSLLFYSFSSSSRFPLLNYFLPYLRSCFPFIQFIILFAYPLPSSFCHISFFLSFSPPTHPFYLPSFFIFLTHSLFTSYSLLKFLFLLSSYLIVLLLFPPTSFLFLSFFVLHTLISFFLCFSLSFLISFPYSSFLILLSLSISLAPQNLLSPFFFLLLIFFLSLLSLLLLDLSFFFPPLLHLFLYYMPLSTFSFFFYYSFYPPPFIFLLFQFPDLHNRVFRI